ncbi:MAG: HAD family hydrolase [Lachnospiraceae bacterium]|jgi:Cof subfamily protein (haloacid dehalogenase superfamily)|nr:HAD family hydrolase [Oribacterium sp.]MDY6316146.1 HAD family hydrolase [Oribacterium sp.]MEE3393981.1 HAD family hydrolase [Lachnospiraceae bacterium]
MIKIIFFDIDGTLRPFETGKIPESAKKAIRMAHSEGILCAIASGRHWLEMKTENLLENLHFDAFVTLDGEYCYVLDDKEKLKDSPYFDPLNGTLVQKLSIPPEEIDKLLRFMKDYPDFSCLFEEERYIYVNKITPELLQVLSDIKTAAPPVDSIEKRHANPIFMLIPVMSHELSLKLEAALPGLSLCRWSDGLSFDLTKKGVSKISGIDAVLKYYNLKLSEAAAIGDGFNDAGMLTHCGLGIAMGNAKSSCKEAADYICPSALSDGLYDAVTYIIKKNHEQHTRNT